MLTEKSAAEPAPNTIRATREKTVEHSSPKRTTNIQRSIHKQSIEPFPVTHSSPLAAFWKPSYYLISLSTQKSDSGLPSAKSPVFMQKAHETAQQTGCLYLLYPCGLEATSRKCFVLTESAAFRSPFLWLLVTY
jgi:hypothetical protein